MIASTFGIVDTQLIAALEVVLFDAAVLDGARPVEKGGKPISEGARSSGRLLPGSQRSRGRLPRRYAWAFKTPVSLTDTSAQALPWPIWWARPR